MRVKGDQAKLYFAHSLKSLWIGTHDIINPILL